MGDLERFRAGYKEWAIGDAGDEDNVHAYIEALEAEVERLEANLRGCDAGRSLLHRQVERLESELREADAYRLTDEEWKKKWWVRG